MKTAGQFYAEICRWHYVVQSNAKVLVEKSKPGYPVVAVVLSYRIQNVQIEFVKLGQIYTLPKFLPDVSCCRFMKVLHADGKCLH